MKNREYIVVSKEKFLAISFDTSVAYLNRNLDNSLNIQKCKSVNQHTKALKLLM